VKTRLLSRTRFSSLAVLIPFLAMGAAAGDDAAWRTAERNWTEFTQVRQAALREARRFVRFRHPLLDRRLPLYHFYSDGVQVYVLARTGEVYAHAQRAHTEPTPAWCRPPLCEVRDASDILQHAGVVVPNEQAAGDAIRLFVLITCNGFVPQGVDVLGAYKPVATKQGAAEWRVHLEYAGASEDSVLMQPSYRIIINRKHRLMELRQVNDLTGPLGERL